MKKSLVLLVIILFSTSLLAKKYIPVKLIFIDGKELIENLLINPADLIYRFFLVILYKLISIVDTIIYCMY